LIIAGQETLGLQHAAIPDHPVALAEPAERTEKKQAIEWTGGRDHAHDVTRLNRAGIQHCHTISGPSVSGAAV
jgi:hypothetical protein